MSKFPPNAYENGELPTLTETMSSYSRGTRQKDEELGFRLRDKHAKPQPIQKDTK